jgi:hypothetical protein
MKLLRSFLLAGLAFTSAWPAVLFAADAPKTAAGYWAGTITTPRGELPLSVELTANEAGALEGTVDCPRQGVRGFKVDAVKVVDSAVEFALTGLPGDPRFSGKLAADGASIAGDFSQGGGVMPFRLERATKPAATPDEHAVPANGESGKGLAGKWRGSIKPVPGIELRLQAELQSDGAGNLTGELISLDQGAGRMPIETLTEKDGAVQFDLPRIRGGFTGKLNAEGSELAGEWSQGGRSTPLVFKRLATKN